MTPSAVGNTRTTLTLVITRLLFRDSVQPRPTQAGFSMMNTLRTVCAAWHTSPCRLTGAIPCSKPSYCKARLQLQCSVSTSPDLVRSSTLAGQIKPSTQARSLTCLSPKGRDICVNGVTVIGGQDAVIDTGTTQVLGDTKSIQAIYYQIHGSQFVGNGTWHIPCDFNTSVSITFSGVQFQISASTFDLGPSHPRSSTLVLDSGSLVPCSCKMYTRRLTSATTVWASRLLHNCVTTTVCVSIHSLHVHFS